MKNRLAVLFTLALLVGLLPATTASAQVSDTDVTYTTDADFDLGTLVSVNHDAPNNDQLQLDSPTEPFPFINVAASGRGTVVRVNTDTGEIVGEYRTAPDGRGLNPSRTTVDLFGSVWTANREEADEIGGVPHGSAVKIGLIAGGTRVDAAGTPDPAGEYLAPPFGYSTCSDRDGDGLIHTSSGLGTVFDWPDVSDGLGGFDGLVEDAVDECILIYQRLRDAEQARHVSVDADNNVWVGGFPFDGRLFYKLDGATGAILDFFDSRDFGCGGYGGLVDGNGILWSQGGSLLRYDPATRTGSCIESYGYGLGIDTNGFVWNSLWNNGIVKISPDGTIEPGFPKSTHPATSTATATGSVSPLYVETEPMFTEASFALLAELPTFSLAPDDDWVQSMNPWTPGATISLTVEDGSVVVYTDSQTADAGGYFNFDNLGGFDLQRGHVVTVSDGVATKTHTVLDLYVDGVDVTADTVFGRADAGTSVDVWVHGDGGLTAAADGSGNWTADFSGMTDLVDGSDGGSQQSDSDGDSTGVWWSTPKFQVAPEDDWVQSSGKWTPGATISLTVEDGSVVVYTDSQTADAGGYFNFDNLGGFDLQRGHVVTVSDGVATKTHTVLDLYVDGVDVTADTVFGRADAGTSVDVWVHGDGGLTAAADGSGNWTADFSGMTDLVDGSDGGSQQSDSDGDSTGVWWSTPKFQVAPEDDWVQSSGKWTPGATISLTVEDGSVVVYTDSQTADAGGYFNFDNLGGFDLQRGHVVTVSDGVATKTHTVLDLYVDGVDVTADTVFGRADAGTSVDVWVHGDGGLTAAADGSGNWTADFSGMTDLTYRSDGGSQQSDDDGDSTGVWWSTPKFQVAPEDDWVQSISRWTPGATISLTVEDGSGVVYTDSQTANRWGDFNFGLGGLFDINTGHVVTISDGTWTKVHIVTVVEVTDIDLDADTVSGTAAPGAWVQVNVGLFGDWAFREVVSDGSGNWTADFSVPWQDQPAFDITEATFVDVQEFDDDYDATYRRFGPPVQANRGVCVTPIDNHVWVANSGVGKVTRLDNDGNIVKVIETGTEPRTEPTGVAVDAAGKVWATNLGSDNTVRIDPNGGADGLGAVDLTVDLGPGAGPYNYSDMTGAVVVGSTSPQGFWTVIQDSSEPDFEWGRVTWNTEPQGSEPAGSEIVVEIRTSNSEAGLGGASFIAVSNGELFSAFGRFIEVRVTLKASAGGLSPVLSDIRVQPATIEVSADIKPTSCPNPFNVGKSGVMPVAILGTSDFDVSQVDPVSVTLEGVAPLRWAYEDVATPFEPYLGRTDAYDCNEYGPDGYTDLALKFEALEIAAALGDVADGDVLVLTLTGYLADGHPILGEDVIVVVKKGRE